MGFFSSHYNRPGPGVSKDEPKENGFIHYWKIYGRHFWDLMKLNMLFSIPAILLLIVFVAIDAKTQNFFLAGIPLIALSPFMAGLTYETRNFIREEHVFISSDFFSKLKENWKQFLANGIICYFVYEILDVAFRFYGSAQNQKQLGNVMTVIAFAISIAVLFIFTVMQFYIPLQIITFDMKLSQIYKNAGIFAITALGWNFLAFLVSTFCTLFLLMFMWMGQYAPLFLVILVAVAIFFLWSFWSYTVNSLVYPTVDRYMLQPALKKNAAEKQGGDTAASTEESNLSDFTDWDSVHDDDDNNDDDEDED
ncbi:MAG: YesL family protein [Oscillospiraceae bacterium]|jgi:MFS family permease|nr:YesL family protein [Oscillospiraceae bacterium]